MKLFCEYTTLVHESQIRLAPALLEIEGSKIQSVQEWRKPLSELPVHTRILKNKMLTPMFVNPHTHLAMSFFRSIENSEATSGNMITDFYFQIESRMSADDVRAFTRMGAYECLLFGVGTVWDHYYHGDAIANALYDVGITGVVAPTLQDLSGPGKDSWEREWESTETIHASTSLAEHGVVAAWGPHATDTVSPELWGRIHDAATHTGLPVHAHVGQTNDEFRKALSRSRCTPLGILRKVGMLESSYEKVLVHGIYLRKSDLRALAQDPHHTMISCPFSQMIFHFPANLMTWSDYKLRWAIATDTVGSNDSMNVQKELRYISGFPLQSLSFARSYNTTLNTLNMRALQQKRQKLWQRYAAFRDPSFLLSKVWQTPGSLHPHLKVATIAEDHFANLIMWDLDNPAFWPAHGLRGLCFNDVAPAIHNLMLKGQWVGQDGAYVQSLCSTSAYQDALKEAKERLGALLRA